MSTYFDYIPEELIIYEIKYYLYYEGSEQPYQDLRQFVQIVPERVAMLLARELNQGLADSISKYKRSIDPTWNVILMALFYYEDFRTYWDKAIREQYDMNRDNPDFHVDKSFPVESIDSLRNILEYNLSEFIFKMLTYHEYPNLKNKINLVIHILKHDGAPWYHLYRSVVGLEMFQFEATYNLGHYEPEGKEKKKLDLLLTMLDTYYHYITNGTIRPYKLKMMSIQQIPILIVYLYYIEELILNYVKFDHDLVYELVKTMIRELPIKLNTLNLNYNFLMHIFQNPHELARIYK